MKSNILFLVSVSCRWLSFVYAVLRLSEIESHRKLVLIAIIFLFHIIKMPDILEDDKRDAQSQEGCFKKIVKNITVEPLVICWLLPYLLTYAAVENLNFEKACRGFVDVESGWDKDICKLFVRKETFDIKCDGGNATLIESIKIDEIQMRFPEIYNNIKENITAAMNWLCATEDPVQKKLSEINSIRNPVSAIGPLIIILFAGPWSDKNNLRVPCMIVPFLGEAIGYLCEISH